MLSPRNNVCMHSNIILLIINGHYIDSPSQIEVLTRDCIHVRLKRIIMDPPIEHLITFPALVLRRWVASSLYKITRIYIPIITFQLAILLCICQTGKKNIKVMVFFSLPLWLNMLSDNHCWCTFLCTCNYFESSIRKNRKSIKQGSGSWCRTLPCNLAVDVPRSPIAVYGKIERFYPLLDAPMWNNHIMITTEGNRKNNVWWMKLET